MKLKNNTGTLFDLLSVNGVGFSHSAILFLGVATTIAVCAGENVLDILRRVFYVPSVFIYIVEE
jgi:hypothetical protein